MIIGAPNEYGCFPVKEDRDGQIHRRVIEPGRIENGVFVAADLSAEPEEIRLAAETAWTPEIVAAWEALLRSKIEPSPDLDAMDTAVLNAALTSPGSVVRALAEIMFAEINRLRVKTGDPAYTKTQFVSALKSKMRG